MPSNERSEWLTVAEVAEHLKLSRSKVYEMAQRAEIPCSKISGRWRFNLAEVDEWVLAQRPGSLRAPRKDDEAWIQPNLRDPVGPPARRADRRRSGGNRAWRSARTAPGQILPPSLVPDGIHKQQREMTAA